MMRVITLSLVLLAGVAEAQVPRGFARPQAGADAQRQQQEMEAKSGAYNAQLGMAGLKKLMENPNEMANVMDLLKDPQAMAEARKMMEDPAFKREMEKIAGPMKKTMESLQRNGVEMGAGAINAQTGIAGLARAMQDPKMIAEAMRAMQDPKMMAEVQRMMQDPSFAQMMSSQMAGAQELMAGMKGEQAEQIASRVRGLADWMQHQEQQEKLASMLRRDP
mmetsp:Transcript_23942/g.70530  ORF Transcript_23942/g.70530 Transcript_23942/m.70530 type:complete len:220 (+) Transcript_23942:41-700(+)|eukprot:CAMPEP_0206043032 /NCGR_PEP_ID=MMETSP1466-20131121/7465_1 /ASSEMBLY_ACC=CAM_ASM_001126 /TAXON_ID=44452 /ORGANISM="Pavlova gyrans, Strain CCMP608" /LENGTH=219 /DNA_ID=CAMNT_0053417783 /DNA_START=1 /DNA_END=660 /DNA_ORIENTATION=+